MWQIMDPEIAEDFNTNILGALATLDNDLLSPVGNIAYITVSAALVDFQKRWGEQLHLVRAEKPKNKHATQEIEECDVDTLSYLGQACLNEMAGAGFLPPLGDDEDGPIFPVPQGMAPHVMLNKIWQCLAGAKEYIRDMMNTPENYHYPVAVFSSFIEFAEMLELCGIAKPEAEAHSRDLICQILKDSRCEDSVIYQVLSLHGQTGPHFDGDHRLEMGTVSSWMAETRRILHESLMMRLGDNAEGLQDRASIVESSDNDCLLYQEGFLNMGVFSAELQRARIDAYHAAALAGAINQTEELEYRWEDFMLNMLVLQDNQIFHSK